MGASSTKRKLDNSNNTTLTKTQCDQLIDYTAQYITKWTQIELKNYSRNSRIPLCWPIPGGGFHIGPERVLPESGYWRRYTADGTSAQLFFEKKSAIFYTLIVQLGYLQTAEGILKYDTDILKLENDIIFYNRGLERAIKNKDCDRIHIFASRLDLAVSQLKTSRRYLQKIFKTTKYLKVWDL